MNEKLIGIANKLKLIGNIHRSGLLRHDQIFIRENSGLFRIADDIFQDYLPELLEPIHDKLCLRKSPSYHPVSVDFILPYLEEAEDRDLMIAKYYQAEDKISIDKLFDQLSQKINQFLDTWKEIEVFA